MAKFREAKHFVRTNYGTGDEFQEDDMWLVFILAKFDRELDPEKCFYLKSLLAGSSLGTRRWRLEFDRLFAIQGDTTFDEKPQDWQGSDDFLNASPAWKDDGAFVFHLANNVPLVQRHACIGKGMHAPIVLQHYLVALVRG